MPNLGWRSTDRKPVKISIPVSEEFAARLDKLAAKKGLNRAEMGRRIFLDALEKAKL